MTAQLKIKDINIKESEATLPLAYYEEVARDTLGILWHQKLLIVGILVVALSVASIALVLVGPRYSAEAMILLNFIREEPATGPKTQSIAAVEAGGVAVVDVRVEPGYTPAMAGALTREIKE